MQTHGVWLRRRHLWLSRREKIITTQRYFVIIKMMRDCLAHVLEHSVIIFQRYTWTAGVVVVIASVIDFLKD